MQSGLKRLLVRWIPAVFVCSSAAIWAVSRYEPPLPESIDVDLRLPAVVAGRSEPLIATGHTSAGDLLFVHFVDKHTITFGYDSWGRPIVRSDRTVPFTPGVPLHLRIAMPGFTHLRGDSAVDPARICVECNGALVLDAPARYYPRDANAVCFAENRLGSSWSTPTLSGTLTRPDGSLLRGVPARFYSGGGRVRAWLAGRPLQALAIVLLGLVLANISLAVSAHRIAHLRKGLRGHRWALIVICLCAATFSAVITWGTFDFTAPERYGVFYDYQANSLLHGHLDVPEQAIAGEAFIFGGRYYGYFGPTPAILRLPFAVFGITPGRLTRLYMLAYFVGALIATYRILCDVTRWLDGPASAPSAWGVNVLLINAGFGSTLLFLGTRAMMYHEAILCGAALGLWSGWCALRQLVAPARRWWLGSLVCGLLAVHARPPAGLFALTLLGCILAYQFFQAVDPDPAKDCRTRSLLSCRIRAGFITGLAFLAVVSFNGLAYLKFRTFDGAPLALSQPYSPARLARIDGKSLHVANVPFGIYMYVFRANFRFDPRFPYFRIGARDGGISFPAAKMDLIDYVLAFPFAMPGLFLLATVLAIGGFVVEPRARVALTLIWAAAVPMSLALFAAVAVAQRYTADFCPLLILSAALGTATLDRLRGSVWWITRPLVNLGTVVAVLATISICLDYQGNWAPNVPDGAKQSYQQFFRRIDGLLLPRQP